MATRLQRPRIRPMWKGGLRRGTVRDTMTAYLAEHPEFAERLFRIVEESRAVNGPPLPLPPHVRTPFDFERR
jgi:hypothetical protein